MKLKCIPLVILSILFISAVAQGAIQATANTSEPTDLSIIDSFEADLFQEESDIIRTVHPEMLSPLSLPTVDLNEGLSPFDSQFVPTNAPKSDTRETSSSQPAPSIKVSSQVSPLSTNCPDGCPTRLFGYLYYTDSDGSARPIRHAYVEIWDSDPLFDDFVISTGTDGSGFFDVTFNNDVDCTGFVGFGCPYPDETQGENRRCECYVVPFSKNDAIAVVFCPVQICVIAADHRWRFGNLQDMPDGDNDYGAPIVPSGDDNEAFRIYDSIVEAWLYIRTQTGVEVPGVGVEFPCGVLCPGAPYFDTVLTFNIRMQGDQSRFTHVHEYGHWVMFKAYDDMWPVPALEQLSCLVHFIERACGIHIGWSEGWADFLPLAVFNNPSLFGISLETPPAQVCYTNLGCFTFENGDAVEGRVAAALWDLFDPNVDGVDEYGVGFGSRLFETFWNGARHSTFREFYDDYRARHSAAELNAAAFQNTINYNNAPRIIGVALPGLSGGWESGLLTISVTASDDTGGYVDGYIRRVTFEYSLDDTNWIAIGSLNIPFPGTNPPYNLVWDTGTIVDHDVRVRAQVTDNLDTQSGPPMETGLFGIDNTPPMGSISVNAGATLTHSRSVTLGLSASDLESGVSRMRFRNENDIFCFRQICFPVWTDWEPFATSKAWTLSLFPSNTHTSVTKTVFVQYRNVAGAESQFSDTITLATTIGVTSLRTSGAIGGIFRVGDFIEITATLEEQVDGVTIHPLTHGTVTAKILYRKVTSTGALVNVRIASVPMSLTDPATGRWFATYGPIPPNTDLIRGFQGTYVIRVAGTDPPAKSVPRSVSKFVANELFRSATAKFTTASSPGKVTTGVNFRISVTLQNIRTTPTSFTLELVLPPGLTTAEPLTKACDNVPALTGKCIIPWTIRSTTVDTKLITVNARVTGSTIVSAYLKWYVRDPLPGSGLGFSPPSELQTKERFTKETGL